MNKNYNATMAASEQMSNEIVTSNNTNRMQKANTKSAGVSLPAANMEITKFNKAYTPTSFGKRNSSSFHREEFEGYSIVECRGEVEGYLYDYKYWFRELVTPKSCKFLIDNVKKYHEESANEHGCITLLHHSNLKKFREFLIRYSDGEFKVAKMRWSNRGAEPKTKYFNELEKRYQNNITKMIDTITSAIG